MKFSNILRLPPQVVADENSVLGSSSLKNFSKIKSTFQVVAGENAFFISSFKKYFCFQVVADEKGVLSIISERYFLYLPPQVVAGEKAFFMHGCKKYFVFKW